MDWKLYNASQAYADHIYVCALPDGKGTRRALMFDGVRKRWRELGAVVSIEDACALAEVAR